MKLDDLKTLRSALADCAVPAIDLRGGSPREIRQGRRADHRRGATPRRARAGGGRGAGAARAMGGGVPAGAAERLHSRRADQFRRGHGPQGHAAQLLRPAGGRQHLRRRERHRHLRGAERGRRDHAPRRWRRLRLLAHPAAGRARQGHEQPRQRTAVLHAGVRPELRDRGVGGLATRRPDGHPALRSSRHRGVHPRQGRRPAHQLQPFGGGDRRLRRRGARQRRLGTRAQGAAGTRSPRGGRAPARRRPVGVSHGARRRAVGPDHVVDVRSRGAGRRVHRRDEPRQQPLVLRDDRGLQSLRRAAAAVVRLLRPRQRRPHALRARSVHARRALRLRRLRRHGRRRRADARQRPRRDRLAAAAAAQGGDGQAPRRAGLHRARRRAHRAGPALRQRRGTRDGRPHRRGDARRRVPVLGGDRQGQGLVPAARHRAVPRGAALRVPPAGLHQGRDPHPRHPQQPHAVDRADRDHFARLRRQRVERHRARVQLVLPAQEAHARRDDEGIPRRGSRLSPVQAPARHRRRGRAAAVRSGAGAAAGNGVDRRGRQAPRDAASRIRQRAADERAGSHADERGRAAVHRHRDQQDGERSGRLPVRRLQGSLLRGVEGRPQGHRHVSPQQRAGLGARGRVRRPRRPPSRRTSTPPTRTGASASTARTSRRCPACAGPVARS